MASAPRDIRELGDGPPEAYWDELRQRWGGLLTYRYIGRKYSSMNTGPVDDTVTLRHDMRNPGGGILASALACCSPGGGGLSDLEVVPNPVITSLHVVDDARDVRRIDVRGGTLKVGTRMYFGRTIIVDADRPERTIAVIEGQGAAIGDVPAGMARFDDDAVMEIADSPDLPPLWQVFDGSRRADGTWQLGQLRVDLASPDAALHVGPQFVVIEAAALDAVPGQTESLHVMFLARGKVGPFRVATEVTRGADPAGRACVVVTIHDEGNADRAITSATVLVRPE